jgi:RNA polymerase sigma-70 factor (ECF subfamily)
MDEEQFRSRLSRISTVWTLLEKRESQPGEQDHRATLIQRYQGAVYRYLLGATRDPDVADDLFQEFALRFIQGAFHGVDRHRGRFRDYLRTVLIHLVCDHQKRQRKQPLPLDLDVMTPAVQPEQSAEADEQFRTSWRDELLARAWATLAQAEREGGQPYHTLLRFRADRTHATAAEMAAYVTSQVRPEEPITETGVRKMLQRARAQFAEALLDDVAHSLGHPASDVLEQELIDLDLLPYCRDAIARRKDRGS